jgi:hypothetical protein
MIAEATIRPLSLSTTWKNSASAPEATQSTDELTSQRDDITRPPREVDVLMIRRVVPLENWGTTLSDSGQRDSQTR